jgi:hypothetical protein
MLRFNPELVLQAFEQGALTDLLYLGVAGEGDQPCSAAGDRRIAKLCRMLGIGLLLVSPASGRVEVLIDSGTSFQPRGKALSGASDL